MKVTINYPIDMGFDTMTVRLTADCKMTNTGIGYYEYGGSVEYHKGEDILDVKNIEWDRHLYTIRENNTIRVMSETDDCYNAFEDAFREIIADRFC